MTAEVKKYKAPRKEPITNFPEKEKRIYLRNKDLLEEINNVKMTFCEFASPEYQYASAYVLMEEEEIFQLNEEFRLSKFDDGLVKLQKTKEDATIDDVIVRVMTYAHIPEDPTRKKKKNSVASGYKKISFPPFKHYILRNNELVEVLRSHWSGDFNTGTFVAYRGKVSNKLAKMWQLLVERAGEHARYRGYSYINEMKSEAIEQLINVGLQFNEAKSENPFSFYTTTVINCFKKIKDIEKEIQTGRDDLLIQAGSSPSFTRQVDHEHHIRSMKFYAEQNLADEPEIEDLPEDDVVDTADSQLVIDDLDMVEELDTIEIDESFFSFE